MFRFFIIIPVFSIVFSMRSLEAQVAAVDGLTEIPTFEYDSSVLKVAKQHIPITAKLCSSRNDRPYQFWRESYLSRDWSHACADAVAQYRQYYLSTRKNPALREESTKNRIEANYATQCLRRLVDVIDEDAVFPKERFRSKYLISMTSKAEVNKLVDSIGVLQSGESKCNSSIIKSGDENFLLLTAAHCIGKVGRVLDKNTKKVGDNSKFLKLYDVLEFESLSGYSFKLIPGNDADRLLSVEFNRFNEDAVIVSNLDVSYFPDNVGLEFVIDPLTPWEPLLVVGVNPYFESALRLSDAQSLLQLASVSLEPHCAVLSNMGGKVLHNCQTEGQLSGSPMLVIRNSEFQVGGVHTGGNLFGVDSCGSASIKARNRGIALENRTK